MAHLDKRGNFALKLFSQVILARVLAIVGEFQLFHGHVVLFVSSFEDISASTCSDLFFKTDVLDIDPEMILASHELLRKNVACLLCLSLIFIFLRRCCGSLQC